MKKLIATLFIMLFGSSLLFSLFAVYVKNKIFPEEYRIYQYKNKVLSGESVVNNSERVIFGDCLGLTSVNPLLLNGKTLNMSFSSSTPIEVYYFIKKYLEHNSVPREITIILSSNQFMGFDQLFQHSLSYNFFTPDEANELATAIVDSEFEYGLPHFLKGIDSPFINDILSKLFTNKVSFKIDYYMGMLLLSKEHLASLKKCLKDRCLSREDNSSSSFLSDNSGHYLYQDNKGPIGIYKDYYNWKNFIVPKLFDYYFEKILNLAQEHKINVVYHHPPVTKHNYDAASNQLRVDFKNYLKKKSLLYPEARLYDSIIVYPNDHFSSNIFINKKGAEKFTLYLDELSKTKK